jgi:hypothetical protein
MVWHGPVHLGGASFVALFAAVLLNTGPMMAAHRSCLATLDSAWAVDGVESTGTSFTPTQALRQACAGEPEAVGTSAGSDPSQQPALFYLMLVGFGPTGGAFLSRRLSAARYGMRP